MVLGLFMGSSSYKISIHHYEIRLWDSYFYQRANHADCCLCTFWLIDRINAAFRSSSLSCISPILNSPRISITHTIRDIFLAVTMIVFPDSFSRFIAVYRSIIRQEVLFLLRLIPKTGGANAVLSSLGFRFVILPPVLGLIRTLHPRHKPGTGGLLLVICKPPNIIRVRTYRLCPSPDHSLESSVKAVLLPHP